MRPNKFRELLRAGKPTLGTRVMSPWPTVIEVLGQAKQYDYVEFLAEYSPSDLHDLDNLCRAAELADLTPIIKIDQAGCDYVAQRAIGAGFQGVLFTDCRSAEEARHAVRIVRPETPQDGVYVKIVGRESGLVSWALWPEQRWPEPPRQRILASAWASLLV